MRLFFLPISTRKAILYCERKARDKTSESTIARKVTDKANQTWTNWERAEKGWKKHLTAFGNKVLSQIPMEEWSLKSVPPLSKQIKREILADIKSNGGSQERRSSGARGAAIVSKAKTEVDVLFPGSFLKEENVLSRIQNLAIERKPLHRRRFWWSLVGMPVVAPLALIPIVPNVPFFYLVYRAWSHWRALRGAEHLEFLHKHRLLRTKSSPMLDELYAAGLLHPSRDPARDSMPVAPEQIRKVAASVTSALQKQQQEEQIEIQQSFRSKTAKAHSSADSSDSSISSQSSILSTFSPRSSDSTIPPDISTNSSTSISPSTATTYPTQSPLYSKMNQDSRQSPYVTQNRTEDADEDLHKEEEAAMEDDVVKTLKTRSEMFNVDDDKIDIMLLRRWNGKLLAERFGLPDMEVEIERAVEQAQSALEKARKERVQKGEMKMVQTEMAAAERRQDNWR